MQVPRSDLRERFASRTIEELRVIASDGGQQYTDAAREEARLELEGRTEPEPVEEQNQPIPDSWLANLADGVRAWRRGLVPESVPAGIRKMFKVGVIATLPGVVMFCIATWELAMTHSLRLTVHDSDVYLLAYGTAGALLAWGVAREHPYAQHLAALIVIVSGCSAAVAMLNNGALAVKDVVASLAGVYATAKYLLLDPEATEYYRRLRSQRA